MSLSHIDHGPRQPDFPLPSWCPTALDLLRRKGLGVDGTQLTRVFAGDNSALGVFNSQDLYLAFLINGDSQLEVREMRWSDAVSVHVPALAVAFAGNWLQFVDIGEDELQFLCSEAPQYPDQRTLASRVLQVLS